MRILHISSAKTIRGGEHQVSLLVEYLAKLNVESVLLCPSGSELSKKNLIGLSKLITYNKFSPANILVSAFIKRVVTDEEIDIVHAHDPHSHQFLFFSYKLFANKVSSFVTRRVSFPIKNTSRAYYAHPLVKKIICVSQSVLRSLDSLELPVEKKLVVHSGIKLGVEKSNDSLRALCKISAGTKIIANLAAISAQKDYITFVKTAQSFISKSDHEVKFVIIGADSDTAKEVKQLVAELNLDEHIIFTGYIPNANLLLDEVDILLSTSVSEGLGNTVMEAMKYQIPVVATNCEGTIDLVKHGESALLAKVGDYDVLANHLIEVLTNGELKSKLVENAHKAIEKFDIHRTTKQIFDLYQSVLTYEQNNS